MFTISSQWIAEKSIALDELSAHTLDVWPDDKRAAVARGRITREAILIPNFR